MLPCRFGRSARSGAFGPTCSPDPHFVGPPDRILTLVLSTRLCYWGSKFHRTSEMLSFASRPYAPLRFKEVIIIGIGYWYWQHFHIGNILTVLAVVQAGVESDFRTLRSNDRSVEGRSM